MLEPRMLLSLLLLSGCGAKPYIDPTFQPYIDSFYQEMRVHGVSPLTTTLGVQFGDSRGFQAYCDMDSRTIIVDRSMWVEYTDPTHELLLYHEMGHCVLEQGHRNAVIMDPAAWKGERPASIMFHTTFADADYTAHKAYYINELFGGPTIQAQLTNP